MHKAKSDAKLLKGDINSLSSLKKPVFIFTLGIGENALNTVRSLGRKKIPVVLVTIKGDISVAVFSKYCDIVFELPELSRESLLNEIIYLTQKTADKPILFIDNCKMVNLLHNDVELLGQYCYLTQGIGNYTDKGYQFDIARKANVAVPKTWKPETWAEYYNQVDTSKKLISKPDFSSGIKPFKLLIADNAIELKSKLDKYVDTPKGLLVQEYIEGGQENVWVSLGYRSPINKKTYQMTAIKYLMYPVYGGVMAVGKVVDNKDVKRASLKLLDSFDYTGIFGFEFKYSSIDDCYYYIEMSPRTEGFHNITTLAGLDLPLIAYKDLNGKAIELSKDYLNSYWINARYTLNSLIQSRSLSTLFRSIKAIFFSSKYQQFSWDDPKPFFKGTKWYLEQLIKKIIRL